MQGDRNGGGHHGNRDGDEAEGGAADGAPDDAESRQRFCDAAVELRFEGGEVGADGGEGEGIRDGVLEGVEGVEEAEGANAVVLGGVGGV